MVQNFRIHLANKMGVDVGSLRIDVSAGSIIIKATLVTDNSTVAAQAANILHQLSGMSSTEVGGLAIVDVTNILLEHVQVAAPSPPPPEPPPQRCENDCPFAANGYCQDGGEGSLGNDCNFGSDCTDCGARWYHPPPSLPPKRPPPPPLAPPPPLPPELCEDTCTSPDLLAPFRNRTANGLCQDGGPGSAGADCPFGSDCSDCGPRTMAPPPSPRGPSVSVSPSSPTGANATQQPKSAGDAPSFPWWTIAIGAAFLLLVLCEVCRWRLGPCLKEWKARRHEKQQAHKESKRARQASAKPRIVVEDDGWWHWEDEGVPPTPQAMEHGVFDPKPSVSRPDLLEVPFTPTSSKSPSRLRFSTSPQLKPAKQHSKSPATQSTSPPSATGSHYGNWLAGKRQSGTPSRMLHVSPPIQPRSAPKGGIGSETRIIITI